MPLIVLFDPHFNLANAFIVVVATIIVFLYCRRSRRITSRQFHDHVKQTNNTAGGCILGGVEGLL